MAFEDEAILKLLVETREGLASVKRFEGEYRDALRQMAAATKAGLDPSSSEFRELQQRVVDTGRRFVEAGERGEASMRQLAVATGKESAELTELRGKLAIARTELDRFNDEGRKGVGGLVDSFASLRGIIAGVAASFIGIKIADFFRGSIEEASQAEDALAQVQAAVTSTGGAARRSVPELEALAKQLEDISTYDGDEILRDLTANLLTFTSVTTENFDRAQVAVLNLAQRLQIDLQSATLQVGKALNAPADGLGALSRAGIQFSDAQKATIERLVETGKTAEAQRIILVELERQFGGAAAAARNTLGGSLKALQVDLGNIKEAFAEGFSAELVKGISDAAGGLGKAEEGARGLGRVIGAVLGLIGPLIPLAEKFGAAMSLAWAHAAAGAGGFIQVLTTAGANLAEFVAKAAEMGAKLPAAFGGELFAGIAEQMRGVKASIEEMGKGAVASLNATAESLAQTAAALWGGDDSLGKSAEQASTAAGQLPPVLDKVDESGKKAAATLRDDVAAGAQVAKRSLEELAAAARAAIEAQGAGMSGSRPSDVDALGKEKAALEGTVAELQAKQEQAGLTAEELAKLTEAQDALSRVSVEYARISREVGNAVAAELDALQSAEGATTSLAQTMQRSTRDFEGARQTLSQLHPEFEQLDENVKKNVQAMQDLGPQMLTLGKSSGETSEAVQGLADNASKFNAEGVAMAEAMGKLGQATGQTGDEAKKAAVSMEDLAERLAKVEEALATLTDKKHEEGIIAAAKALDDQFTPALNRALDVALSLKSCLQDLAA